MAWRVPEYVGGFLNRCLGFIHAMEDSQMIVEGPTWARRVSLCFKRPQFKP